MNAPPDEIFAEKALTWWPPFPNESLIVCRTGIRWLRLRSLVSLVLVCRIVKIELDQTDTLTRNRVLVQFEIHRDGNRLRPV